MPGSGLQDGTGLVSWQLAVGTAGSYKNGSYSAHLQVITLRAFALRCH
jgi:NhaP-type Na+/H+ or K+/H+ antiporter